MPHRPTALARVLASSALVLIPAAASAQLAVTSTVPALNAGGVARSGPFVIGFDRPVNPATFTPASFRAFGKWSGPVAGTLTFSNADQTVTLTPTRPLAAGESVMLIMSSALRGADNSALRSAGYTLTFSAASNAAPGHTYRRRATISDRDASNNQTRIYGGLACDLNRDGWSDLTIINEVSADVRVLMNRADGTGLFGPMLTPYTDIPFESSPNEPGDFNNDGFVDLVTTSNAENTMAILFGNGDGTFDPAVVISTDTFPRGLGVLDADGDGDLDIAVANTSSSNIQLWINNGLGAFAPATAPALHRFDGGINGEYGLVAAEMTNDGILDLVVAGNSQQVSVLRGNGNGTFTPMGTRPIGGSAWVVACADLNGDGHLDVTTANSGAANGTVLLGNGNGTLQPGTSYPTSGHTVATDLVDLDADGDMDMILSSFGGGRWHTYTNNGSGIFTPGRIFIAPANPACCLPADFDNDGDVDLALIDEIADVIVMMASVCPADFNTQGGTTVQDIFDFLSAYFGNNPEADFNGQGGITVQDIFDFLGAYFSSCV